MGLKDFFTKGPRVGRTRRDPLEEGGKQLGEELAAVWEERTKGKQLASGRFPGETPFQELKILNNVENFLKNIKKTVDFCLFVCLYFSWEFQNSERDQWLATAIPHPERTQCSRRCRYFRVNGASYLGELF